MTKEELAENNMRLVHSIAHKHVIPGYDYDDVVGCGMLGLAKALNSYDQTKGIAFTTYAFPIIRNEMLEIARKNQTAKRTAVVVSMDITVGEGHDMALAEVLPYETDIESDYLIREQVEAIRKLLPKFKQTQKLILNELLDGNLTITEIAKKLGKSKQTVWNGKIKVIAKIKNMLKEE